MSRRTLIQITLLKCLRSQTIMRFLFIGILVLSALAISEALTQGNTKAVWANAGTITATIGWWHHRECL